MLLRLLKKVLDNFNPHSREGSDNWEHGALVKLLISIHTPAKGVTSVQGDGAGAFLISIHTPAKGVTVQY